MLSEFERHELYRKQAKAQYGSDDIEIDPGAKISEGDDSGAFVAAWVWVGDREAGICECGQGKIVKGSDVCQDCIDKEDEE